MLRLRYSLRSLPLHNTFSLPTYMPAGMLEVAHLPVQTMSRTATRVYVYITAGIHTYIHQRFRVFISVQLALNIKLVKQQSQDNHR
jgi:hypothetical protein